MVRLRRLNRFRAQHLISLVIIACVKFSLGETLADNLIWRRLNALRSLLALLVLPPEEPAQSAGDYKDNHNYGDRDANGLSLRRS